MNDEVGILEFTPEQINNQGCLNAESLWLTTTAFFIEKGSGLEDWVDYVGTHYASSWEELKGKSSFKVLKGAVLNWVSCGAKLVSSSGDEQRAEAVLEFPQDNPQETLKIDYQDAHRLNRVFIPIANFVGLNFEYHSEGKLFRIVFYR